MSKELLKDLIDLIDDSDTDIIYKVLIKFFPTGTPMPDETKAIKRADKSILENGTISHDAINWY